MSLDEELQPIIVHLSRGYSRSVLEENNLPLEKVDNYIAALQNIEISAYSDIASAVSSKEPIILQNDNDWSKADIRPDLVAKIAEHANKGPSLILGLYHYGGGLVYNTPDTAFVTFDAHNDSYVDQEFKDYANGSFLAFREGPSFVMGTNVWSNDKNKVAWAKPKNSESLIEKIPENIVLSLDIDCYDKNVTNAFRYSNEFHIFEGLVKKLGGTTHFSEQDVLNLTSKIIEGRNVKALDISEYNPFQELEIPQVGLTSQSLDSVTKSLKEIDTNSLPTVGLLKRYVDHAVDKMYSN